MRPACPPLLYGCKYLNFSRSSSNMELITRRIIGEIEKDAKNVNLDVYANPDSEQYAEMIKRMCKEMNFTSLAFNRIDDMVEAVGLPKEKLCTYCWDGQE